MTVSSVLVKVTVVSYSFWREKKEQHERCIVYHKLNKLAIYSEIEAIISLQRSLKIYLYIMQQPNK